MQKVKFVTGMSCFGGSTVALIEHCKLLKEIGYEAELYGSCDWHVGRCDNCRGMSELTIMEDDFLIFHYMEMAERPNCRRCLLYLHERDLFPLGERVVSGYDGFLFVSDSQMKYHGREGLIVPNPMGLLVDKSKHNPPGMNVAGIVGTIQPRKRQHISIMKALEGGADKVLLFGDKEDLYFEADIVPLLSDRVVYRGFYEPERRMEMYNEFDNLYHFSADESASLVVGECKMLGKPVFKGDEVADYHVAERHEVAAAWRRILSVEKKVDRLVCVITHSREDFVDKWLRAWNNAEKFGAKIAVLHAFDGEAPDESQRQNIIKHVPDFYVPFKNDINKDLKGLRLVVENKLGLPEFDTLFWFTDDMLPMRRGFLKPFLKIDKPGVGLVAQCYEPKSTEGSGGHIRTVAYAITKEAAEKLEFPEVGFEGDRRYYFESGKKGVFEKHLLNQVVSMGMKFELCHSEPDSDGYQHWTSFLDWMWDCHLLGNWKEYERVYERQFNSVQPFEGVLTKRETLLTQEQCEKMTLAPGKVCAIVPTSTAPLKSFMLSVFSLFLRSDLEVFDHLIVSINGPDDRTGDPSNQDLKQRFIEDLRNAKWRRHQGGMPITLIRAWSRLGHAQSLEQCIPWVHTEFYLAMHDDVLVLDSSWCDRTRDFKENDDLICVTHGNPVIKGLSSGVCPEGSRLNLPHFSSIFTLCSKPKMKSIGASWVGYHIPMDFKIDNLWDYEDFVGYHRRHNLLCDIDRVGSPETDYKVLSMDIGSCFLHELFNRRLKVMEFDEAAVKHFSSLSWAPDRIQKFNEGGFEEIKVLEAEIMAEKEFASIYSKYAGAP